VGRVTKWPSAAAGAVVGGGAGRGGRRQKRRRQARAGLLLVSSAASATLPPPRFPSVENGSNHPRSETGRAPENVEIRRSTSLTSCIASPPDAMSRRLRPGKTVNQRARKTTLCELRNSGFAASRPTAVSPQRSSRKTSCQARALLSSCGTCWWDITLKGHRRASQLPVIPPSRLQHIANGTNPTPSSQQ